VNINYNSQKKTHRFDHCLFVPLSDGRENVLDHRNVNKPLHKHTQVILEHTQKVNNFIHSYCNKKHLYYSHRTRI